MSISRLTFSFDSSGWLYVYHLGVAHYLAAALPQLEASAPSRARRAPPWRRLPAASTPSSLRIT